MIPHLPMESLVNHMTGYGLMELYALLLFETWFRECFQLYNYEVAETFFLCKNTSQYVELEFGAHGEHLVLFLNGRRNDIMKMLPLNYTASIGKYILQLL